MTTHTPTEQQAAIIQCVVNGAHVAVQALAGTGKTTTLGMIVRALAPRQIRYITFNARNAREVSAEFASMSNVTVSTGHALALRACRTDPTLEHWAQHAGTGRVPFKEEFETLGVDDFAYVLSRTPNMDKTKKRKWNEHTPKFSHRRRMLSLARKTVIEFCQSADDEVLEAHLPKDLDRDKDIRAQVLRAAQRMWKLLNEGKAFTPNHAYYYKAWSLSNPLIGLPGDVIAYDEAQDAAPVLLKVLLAQQHRCQMVFVGDSYQMIYGFTGSVDGVARLSEIPGVTTLPLTTSYRFGQSIAASANGVLKKLGSRHELVGEGPDEGTFSTVDAVRGMPDAIVCRANSQVLRHAMWQVRAGRKVHSTLNPKALESLAKDIRRLQQGETESINDPILSGVDDLDTWLEAKTEDGNDDLRSRVRAILSVGIDRVLQLASRLVSAEEADVVVSTVHKAKGGTWDHVVIDLPLADDQESRKLLYVARTRARVRSEQIRKDAS